METITRIEKEQIPGIKFTAGEVLANPEERNQRLSDLNNAMTLGNAFHNKIKLIFQSADGIRQVETTIWATTENSVVLKSGINIPIHCILQVII